MSKALPYFKFYPEVWLSDGRVRLLTFEERGIYHELLALMWTYKSGTCRLPDDNKRIASALGLTVQRWRSIRRVLVDGEDAVID